MVSFVFVRERIELKLLSQMHMIVAAAEGFMAHPSNLSPTFTIPFHAFDGDVA
jgi:hypothetical protein